MEEECLVLQRRLLWECHRTNTNITRHRREYQRNTTRIKVRIHAMELELTVLNTQVRQCQTGMMDLLGQLLVKFRDHDCRENLRVERELRSTEMMISIFGLLLFGFHFAFVHSYRNGLIISACDSMTPGHGYSAQTSASMYTVSASNYSFSPGDQITVTLQANSNVTFRGFLLQARSVPGNNRIGRFTVVDSSSAQILSCSGSVGSAVSHTNSGDKSRISVLWTAPVMSPGDVRFSATFVQTFNTFWVGIESPILTDISSSSSTNVTVSDTTLPPNVSATAASSTSHHASSLTLSNTASSLTSTSISRSLCGIDKVCFSNPTDCDPSTSNSCHFMSSALSSGGGYWFEISGPSNGYVAFGFSDDTKMGNDDIYICVLSSSGMVEVQHAFSEGETRPRLLPLGNVEVRLASYSNGVLQCSFISKNNISTQNPVQRSSNSLYYIFLANGPTSNGQISYHTPSGRFRTISKVDLSVAGNVTSSRSGVSVLVKTHGALMLIAWMTTGSLGMIFARYFKVTGKQLVLGKAIWFQAHVIFMVLTVCATITAFVLAFVQAQGWNYGTSTHSIIGTIVMILALIQPFVALFRPSPQSNRRFIFNWFHAVNALVIKVLAVANLFLGLQFIGHSQQWLVKVMGGFVGWEGLSFISLEINAQLAQKEKSESLDISGDSNNKVKTEIFLLLIYLCGNLAFLVALLVGIGQS
ncbi:putative ferric-chelate reductase 1 [Rhinophrynus dorsalis]